MQRLRTLLKKLFTPVTIMFVPHSSRRPFNLKLPSAALVLAGVLSIMGLIYTFSVTVTVLQYYQMKQKLNYYSAQFLELSGTMAALRKSEAEFRRLFALEKKEEVLENYHTDSGALDMEALKEEIEKSIASVSEIKEYLGKEKTAFDATPRGWPTDGELSSRYGRRVHPVSRRTDFHSGVDISTDRGREVRATANGVVSFAGWSGGNGNLVVLEHGLGYSTIYAHNDKVHVRAGQVIKRGDVIASVGSTGISTGPHIHYEVWKEKRPVNPAPYLEGKVW